MDAKQLANQDLVPDCESVGLEHDWEKVEYDPTVGILGHGRTCVVCEKFETSDDDD
jgi:hypothetical protein